MAVSLPSFQTLEALRCSGLGFTKFWLWFLIKWPFQSLDPQPSLRVSLLDAGFQKQGAVPASTNVEVEVASLAEMRDRNC